MRKLILNVLTVIAFSCSIPSNQDTKFKDPFYLEDYDYLYENYFEPLVDKVPYTKSDLDDLFRECKSKIKIGKTSIEEIENCFSNRHLTERSSFKTPIEKKVICKNKPKTFKLNKYISYEQHKQKSYETNSAYITQSTKSISVFFDFLNGKLAHYSFKAKYIKCKNCRWELSNDSEVCKDNGMYDFGLMEFRNYSWERRNDHPEFAKNFNYKVLRDYSKNILNDKVSREMESKEFGKCKLSINAHKTKPVIKCGKKDIIKEEHSVHSDAKSEKIFFLSYDFDTEIEYFIYFPDNNTLEVKKITKEEISKIEFKQGVSFFNFRKEN